MRVVCQSMLTPHPSIEQLQQVKEFRAKAKELSDEVLVVLVGDMITEEALPTYQTLLNTFEGASPTG